MANFWKKFGEFFTGTPEQYQQKSLLSDQQQPLQNQLVNAAQNRGAGGAFGESADYYRNLLSDNSEDFNAFAAPELRRFNQQTIPDLSAQFAGLGAGDSGLTGSGFRNAALNAGTDLSERLGAIRAQLRQTGAQGLQSIGEQGLKPYTQNVLRPQQQGFLQQLAPIVGSVAGAFGGPALGTLGANWANQFNTNTPASPKQGTQGATQ
jgi:hypothetical protein